MISNFVRRTVSRAICYRFFSFPLLLLAFFFNFNKHQIPNLFVMPNNGNFFHFFKRTKRKNGSQKSPGEQKLAKRL
jgi:hypothetical protein